MSWYVSLRCSQCHRVGGAVICGEIGQKRIIGCTECGKQIVVALQDNLQCHEGSLDVDLGIYEYGWMC